MRVLRILDRDDRHVMGYLYNVIDTVKEEMLRRFQKRKRVEPYIDMHETHWDSQLIKNLHVTGFGFKPIYQYTNRKLFFSLLIRIQ